MVALFVRFLVCVAAFVGVAAEAWAWEPFYVTGRCKKSRLSCRTTLGNAGGRGACCDPSKTSATQCAQDDPCTGTYRYHWPASKLPLKWNFNPNNMAGQAGFRNISATALEIEVKRAVDAWSAPTCSAFRHAYQGRTSARPNRNDGIVTIFIPDTSEWPRLGVPPSVLAFSSPHSNSRGELLDADIMVNPQTNLPWNVPPVSQRAIDFTDVIAHEMGHSLGLAHSPNLNALMYYSLRGNGPLFKGISADDRDGICTLYPGNNTCTKNDDCAPCYRCVNGKCEPPEKPLAKLCRSCFQSADCGASGVCVNGPAGGRCFQPCATGACCPTGYRCLQAGTSSLCLPLESFCPAITCTSDTQCGAGGKCNTTTKRCRAPDTYDYKLCHKSCNVDSDCASSLHQCVEFGTGQKRCVVSCPNFLCPRGFSCKPTQNGQHCIPENPDFCPCRTVADCPAGRVCRNFLCVSATGGQYGEPCSDLAPCAKDLQCENLVVGSKCVHTCHTKACPNGLECVRLENAQRICLQPPSREPGQGCDGVLRRCKSGLSCVRLLSDGNEAYCVESCTLQSTCRNGGTCNLDGTPRYCQCGTDADCGSTYKCTTLVSGIRICTCKTQPCGNPCGDGVCDEARGENCNGCPQDCKCQTGFTCSEGFCVKTATCGDGVCETNKGENCGQCPQDCKCEVGAICNQDRCHAPACGDGICTPTNQENCVSCPGDCKCPSGQVCVGTGACASNSCGNQLCEAQKGENCSTCVGDCKCKDGFSCDPQQKTCVADKPTFCGDGTCQANKGENCTTCPKDCVCINRLICDKGSCVTADSLCPPYRQEITCDSGDRNCQLFCQKPGCSCSQDQNPLDSLPLGLALLFLFFSARIRRR